MPNQVLRRARDAQGTRRTGRARVLWACAALAALLCTGPVQAQTYRWLDADGGVHYSNMPPPREARQVERKQLQGNVVQGDALPYATRLAAQNFPVTLYTSQDCGAPCDDGRKLLETRGVPFKEIRVTDETSRATLKAVSGGDSVPFLVVGRDTRQGYEPGSWQAALDTAGYPQAAPRSTPQRSETTAGTPADADTKPGGNANSNSAPRPGPYAPR